MTLYQLVSTVTVNWDWIQALACISSKVQVCIEPASELFSRVTQTLNSKIECSRRKGVRIEGPTPTPPPPQRYFSGADITTSSWTKTSGARAAQATRAIFLAVAHAQRAGEDFWRLGSIRPRNSTETRPHAKSCSSALDKLRAAAATRAILAVAHAQCAKKLSRLQSIAHALTLFELEFTRARLQHNHLRARVRRMHVV